MKIAVVHDPFRSTDEQKMVETIAGVLSRKRETKQVVFGDDFIRTVKAFDMVFNLSIWGGREGRQVHVPAILDVLGIPYTGSPVVTHSLCLDKVLTKIFLQKHGVPTPAYQSFEVGQLPDRIDGKMFVKPSREGSAMGIHKDSLVSDLEHYRKKVQSIHERFGEPALAEEFIEGKELTIGFLGNSDTLEVLPILEIDFSHLPDDKERFFSYEVKHEFEEQTRFFCPARINDMLASEIQDAGKLAFKALGLRDYARMDVRVRGEEFFFIDVNSMPQLVPGYSDLPKMAAVAGYSYENLIEQIMETAMARYSLSE